MTRINVLDPTAAPPDVDSDPGPGAGQLRGRKIGIRHDTAWRSFGWVIDEWGRELTKAGADVQVWVAGNRVGEEGERTFQELEEFSDRADVAIVGLGN